MPAEAGAEFLFRQKTGELAFGGSAASLEDVQVEGLQVTGLSNGKKKYFPADIVADATGAASALRTQFSAFPSLGRPYGPGEFASVFRTVRRIKPPAGDYVGGGRQDRRRGRQSEYIVYGPCTIVTLYEK